MKIEVPLGKAALLPGIALAAVFAPQTLLYAAGMYVAGSVSGAYLEAATANAAARIKKDYENADEAASLCEALGHMGNGFVRIASMACPAVPFVAFAAGRHMNKKTFPKVSKERSFIDM